MDLAAFCEWLHSLHVVVIDDGRSCAKQQSWLLQTGAMVTHVPQPAQAIELARARAHDLDLLLIDADAHVRWLPLVEQVPPACAALIVSTEPDLGMLRGVMELGAAYISRDAPAQDFIFSVHNVSVGRAPQLERLLPVTDQSQLRIEHDRARLLAMRSIRYET